MTVHTPGPWLADGAVTPYKYHEGAHHFQIDAPTPQGIDKKFPYTVADTSNRHYGISPDEDAANARLIAAAPELLEALELLWENPDRAHNLAFALSAIRKARGETA